MFSLNNLLINYILKSLVEFKISRNEHSKEYFGNTDRTMEYKCSHTNYSKIFFL